MRIAYFNATLKAGQDGVSRVVYRMMDGAVRRGHDVLAITSTLPDPGDRIVPMLRVPSLSMPLQKNYRIALPGYHPFARRLREFRPDILHINSPCTLGFGAMKYAQHFDIPIVATYHTHFPAYPRYYNLEHFEGLTWNLTRYLYNNMDRTFVPARPILAELGGKGIRGLEYLPNGVDVGLFRPERRSGEWRKRFGGGEKPIILFVSRLVWEKDLCDLAGMYRLLRRHEKDFEMVVIGDGHAREEFQKMMPGAHFLGYVSGIPLAESFASSDIFVFPSTTETFGLVTLEAMASGLTPVAVRMGGALEIIQDGVSGLLAQPHDASDIASKVELLIDDPELRKTISHNAYAAAQPYQWEKVLDRLFSSYADVSRTFGRNRDFRVA